MVDRKRQPIKVIRRGTEPGHPPPPDPGDTQPAMPRAMHRAEADLDQMVLQELLMDYMVTLPGDLAGTIDSLVDELRQLRNRNSDLYQVLLGRVSGRRDSRG